MTTDLEWLSGGGVTAPLGWQAGAVAAGIKGYGEEPRLDLAILASDTSCTAAGIFTRNAIVGPAVSLTRERLSGGTAQALIVNSGNANTVTGSQGERDTRQMAALAANHLRVEPENLLVASTGVIGRPLPMELVERGIPNIQLSRDGGHEFSRAIMTTDRFEKERAVRINVGHHNYTVGGVAKGSGMIHPDLATCFCFLTTDAPVEASWLASTLRSVADVSINMIDIDMDTSTSDTMLVLANGAAGGNEINATHENSGPLQDALEAVAVALARDLARDGEGANTLIEVIVEGAASSEDARLAARTVSSSPLVKTMITGRDPNWGRVLMAVGRSGASVSEQTTSVWIGDHCTLDRGTPTDVDLALVSDAMDSKEVGIRINLGQGSDTATAWGCDLTAEYVRINAEYTT